MPIRSFSEQRQEIRDALSGPTPEQLSFMAQSREFGVIDLDHLSTLVSHLPTRDLKMELETKPNSDMKIELEMLYEKMSADDEREKKILEEREKKVRKISDQWEKTIDIIRKGIRFVTRVSIPLRDMIYDVDGIGTERGTMFTLSNPYRFDYIEDIYAASTKPVVRIDTYDATKSSCDFACVAGCVGKDRITASHRAVELSKKFVPVHFIVDKPSILPVSDMFTFYRFKYEDFDLDSVITGVIFGNSLRKLYNEVKMMYSTKVFVNYTYPFLLTRTQGMYTFGVGSVSEYSSVPQQDERHVLQRSYVYT